METRRSNVREGLWILNQAGDQPPPQTGDELPEAGTKMMVEKGLDDLLRDASTETPAPVHVPRSRETAKC
jgi:hypothetical protein